MPATQPWVAVVRVRSAGVESLPMSARIAILVGIALPLLERLWPKARPWLPSAMGIGIGWVVIFSNELSFAIGALIAWPWSKFHARSQDRFNVPIVCESLIKALLATAIGLAG